MTVKNAVAKRWTNTAGTGQIVPDPADGRRYSKWRDGNRPGTAPVLLYTDFVAGPTTGGDGNNGAFLTLYGFNFGNFSDWGVTNHVTIGGVEVANYRCLTSAVGSGSGIGRGVYDTWGIKALTVQVGGLGSPTAGVALPIAMTVNGTSLSNSSDGSGNYYSYVIAYDGTRDKLTFTPQPGTIYFLDQTNGSDANSGLTVALPKKTLQGSTGFTGVLLCATGALTDGVKPGIHIYDLTNGTVNGGGNGGFAATFFRITGTAPTGAANRGPICYTRYPGAAGANTPTNLTIQGVIDGGGNGGGGFNGADNARAAETNPYEGTAGWGHWIHISNIKIISSANAARDGAPIALGSGSDYNRVVNCDLSLPWVSNASGVTNMAGINGNGKFMRHLGNWIHDIRGVVADNQCHGIYYDGSVACVEDTVAAWNCIYDCRAGNSIQTFNSQASDTIKRVSCHNNWLEKPNKHGLNRAQNTESRIDFNNVVVDAGEAAINTDTGVVLAANGIKAYNNVCYGWARVLTNRNGWWNQGGNGTSPASTDTRNNVFCQKTGSTGTYGFVAVGAGTDNFTKNVFYDEAGILSSVSATYGTYHDPGFSSTTLRNFALTSASFCIDFGASPLIARPFDFFGNLVTGTPDVGVHEYGAHL
jgi:hypothetical protein